MIIVIPVLDFGKEGGYKVLSKLANHFTSKKHKVFFLAPTSASLPYHPTEAAIWWFDKRGKLLSQNSTEVGYMPTWDKIAGLHRAIRQLSAISEIDIILANFYLTTFAIWLARPKGTVLFYYIQAYEPEFFQNKKGLLNWLYYRLSKLSYKLPFIKIANADHYRNYKELKTDKVVYPGLNLQTYQPSRRRTFMEDGRLRIGTIGRKELYKGTAEILSAYRQLYNSVSSIELHLAFGNEKMAEKLAGVVLVQPHGDHNLASFYRQIDVYVSAVLVDGPAIHYPVLEAMACGTPVITTTLYPADISNAIIIDKESRAIGVEAGIRQLLQSDDNEARQQRVAKGLRDIQQFDWDILGDKMLCYFEATIAKAV